MDDRLTVRKDAKQMWDGEDLNVATQRSMLSQTRRL